MQFSLRVDRLRGCTMLGTVVQSNFRCSAQASYFVSVENNQPRAFLFSWPRPAFGRLQASRCPISESAWSLPILRLRLAALASSTDWLGLIQSGCRGGLCVAGPHLLWALRISRARCQKARVASTQPPDPLVCFEFGPDNCCGGGILSLAWNPRF